jgi:hypothetical protein
MNTTNSQNTTTLTIEVDPAQSGQDTINQAVHAFFCVLQTWIDKDGKHDLGGYSAVNHDERIDTLTWQAHCIAKDYQAMITNKSKWIVTHDVYLCYPNARPTLIKAGTEVVCHDDGAFKTISTTGAKPHTIPADAVSKAE